MKLVVRYDSLPAEEFGGTVVELVAQRIVYNNLGPVFQQLKEYAPTVTVLILRTESTSFSNYDDNVIDTGNVTELALKAITYKRRERDLVHQLTLTTIPRVCKVFRGIKLLRFIGFWVPSKDLQPLRDLPPGYPRLDLDFRSIWESRKSKPQDDARGLSLREFERLVIERNAASGAEGRIPPMR